MTILGAAVLLAADPGAWAAGCFAALTWLAVAGCSATSASGAGEGGFDGGPFCNAPLSPDAGISTLGDVPFAQWCAARSGNIREWTCGSYTAIGIPIGIDGDREYFFDTTSGRLVAVFAGGIGERCVMGKPDFKPPADCWSNVTW